MEGVFHFREWVRCNQRTGINGDSQECPYVPQSFLKKYWNEVAIREVLDSSNIHENVNWITHGFLSVFSTLVYIGQPQNISLFLRKNLDDLQLPLYELPFEWSPDLDTFIEEQWMFCPLQFTEVLIYKRELHRRHILPVTYLESLREGVEGGGGPSLHKVEIHPECNKMTETETPVVFKVFKGPSMERLYRAEASAYSRLLENPKNQKTITKHYGSFSFPQTDTRFVVFEYAAMGSLLEFFEKVPPPVTPRDFELLWHTTLKLLPGLHDLQNLAKSSVEGRSTECFGAAIHQDIQPANILVFPSTSNSSLEEKSRFHVRFKLAGFGLTGAKNVSKCGEYYEMETGDSCMYSAPEYYGHYSVQSQVSPAVTTTADVWTLGAVFSDLLVWSLAGDPGRERYRKSRKDAIAKLGHIKARGFEACFHDGEEVLDEVRKFHSEVLQHRRENDYISERLSQFILHHMLMDATRRTPLPLLIERAHQALSEARNHIEPSQSPRSSIACDLGQMSAVSEDTAVFVDHHLPSWPSDCWPAIPHERPHGSTVGQAPVDKLYELLGKKKKKSFSFGRARNMLQSKHFDLPEMEYARSQIKARGGRDQIILVDNFESMQRHVEQVARTARVLSYVTKVADNDGLELFFASDSAKSGNYSTSTAVESAIRRKEFAHGKCNMENCLLNIMKVVFKDDRSAIKPTSIYVYTDAMWQDAGPVSSVIKKAISRLAKAQEASSTLMFQFIQFGDDERGGRCLQRLDDECKERHGDVEYDIVDTKRWYAEIPSIVIGSISKANDEKASTASW